jgi:hypothetical protein
MVFVLSEDNVRETREKTLVKGLPLNDWSVELERYLDEMSMFQSMEPDLILRKLSSFTARASLMRHHVVRVPSKTADAFRNREIDPFISECDRQFKIWSRMVSILNLDWDMSKGQ